MSSHQIRGAVNEALYRAACARFATGITVVTVLDGSNHPHGMTANSFCSISLKPPLVLVAIDRKNAILGHFLSSTHFGINVLAQEQEHLSRRFSNPEENRFEGVAWHIGRTGVPLLEGVLARIECSVSRSFEAGDHTVLLGEVRTADFRDGDPLVFFNSSYRVLTDT